MADDLGKPTLDLLNATRAIIERDIGLGLVEPERLRFTIEARKVEAKKLIESGLSQRKAAEVLGVSHETVRADVSENLPKTVKKSDTPKPDKKPVDPEQHLREVTTANIADALTLLNHDPKNAAYDAAHIDRSFAKRMKQELSAERLRRAAQYLNALADEMERVNV